MVILIADHALGKVGLHLVVTRMAMKGIEERLNTGRFMRVHKSFIVALNKITSVQKTQLMVAGVEIPIEEGYRHKLLAYISSRNL